MNRNYVGMCAVCRLDKAGAVLATRTGHRFLCFGCYEELTGNSRAVATAFTRCCVHKAKVDHSVVWVKLSELRNKYTIRPLCNSSGGIFLTTERKYVTCKQCLRAMSKGDKLA